MAVTLITLAVALLAGLLMSRLAKKIGLPAVTAYLVAGLLLGPFCLGRLNVPGIGFSSLETVDSFAIVSKVALAFIAFSIGNEFRLKDLKAMGTQAIFVGIAESVTATVFVDIVMIVIHFLRPDLLSLSSAITLGAIAAATAPAATLMVVQQYKAKGPLTKLLLMVVALDDAVCLILFALSFGIANALESGTISLLSVLLEPVLEIVLSVVLGVAGGFGLNYIEKFYHSRSKRLSVVVGFVMLVCGISMLEFEVGGVKCSFSLLLVCMITSAVFCNICDASEELLDRLSRWTAPVNVLFFVLSGAELNLSVLSNVLVLLIGLVYIVFRSAGKYTGARLSCRATHAPAPTQKYLGITLLPQAGVALGMSMTAASLMQGEVIRNVILFSVLIYELFGPTLTKRALISAGEIDLGARRSARQTNAPQA